MRIPVPVSQGLKALVHVTMLVLVFFLVGSTVCPGPALGRIYIDINAPSIPKFKAALPEFHNQGKDHASLGEELPGVVSGDLDLSGYFVLIPKEAFLEKSVAMAAEEINFKNWSVIGAEFLIKGTYVCLGTSLEVEVRLFDVYSGKQIIGKKAVGRIDDYRYVMHKISNEILYALTGYEGMCLTKVVYVGTATGNKELYVADYDGYNVRGLTSNRGINVVPRLSPDGNRVLFTSYKDGGPHLYLMDVTSRSLKKIAGKTGVNMAGSWAPDGISFVMSQSQDGNSDIFSMDLRGSALRHLVSDPAIDVSPSLSPDGKRMAFVSDRSGSPQIYILTLGSGAVDRLTFEGTYNQSPNWSSLNRIAYAGMMDGKMDIFTIDPDGARLRRLTEGQGYNEDPCWSPDGRYIMFTSNREGGYHLYIMTANGDNQKQTTFQKGGQISPSWAR